MQPVDIDDIHEYSLKERRRQEKEAFIQKMEAMWNQPDKRFKRWWRQVTGKPVTSHDSFMENVRYMAEQGWPDVS